MSKILGVAQKVFSGVDTTYLVKSYFFAIILAYLSISGALTDSPSLFSFIYIGLCTIFFPFATVVWDDLITTLMGDNAIVLPILIMLCWKLFKLIMLFVLTPVIAPIGFIYIYLANGYHHRS